MKVLELFSGTESFSKVARERGHEAITIDNNPIFNPTYCKDLKEFTISDKFNVIWCSPPCQSFSVATIGRNWDKVTKKPKTDRAKEGVNLVERAIFHIHLNKPKFWFIENPRGMLRTLIDDLFKKWDIKDYVRHTVTYCQYGDKRMKPTDIWTNCKNWKPKPPCKNGMPCHVSAPRGSRTGTQGLKNATMRGVIPRELCSEILGAIEKSDNCN